MTVNGIVKEFKNELTLEQYLLHNGFTLTRIAVELNGAIIPKANYGKVILSDKDKIEIIHFVGGG